MQPVRRQQPLSPSTRTLLFAGAPARSPPVILDTCFYKLSIRTLPLKVQQYSGIPRVLPDVCLMISVAEVKRCLIVAAILPPYRSTMPSPVSCSLGTLDELPEPWGPLVFADHCVVRRSITYVVSSW
jgi:hypothetical protein